jgi:methanogenic corrinoid protein MtbC1
MSGDLTDAIVAMRGDDALLLTKQLLEQGEDPGRILDDAREALNLVGTRFEEGVYFLPELMMAGEIMTEIAQVLKPLMKKEDTGRRMTRIVFGTVEGDIHDIGKDIVVFVLEANGFEVFDLGVDVSPLRFVAKVREAGAPILGLSGFLHCAHEAMKHTIEALEEEGLRNQVKVMIGGGQVDEHVMHYTGADAWGRDAMAAVSLAKEWTEQGADHG